MEVRQLLAADAEAWFALQQREMPDPLTEAGLRAEFESHRSLRLGLWRGDELSAVFLGWVVVDELQVIQIATASEARRQGLGARLLKAAIERGKSLGVVRVTLEVRRSNAAAITLYERAGFIVDGLRPRFYGGREDAVLMSLDVTDAG